MLQSICFSKDDFFKVFPAPSSLVSSVGFAYSANSDLDVETDFNLVVEWLSSFQVNVSPPIVIERAIKNIFGLEDQLVEVYVELIRNSFAQKAVGDLSECLHDNQIESDGKDHTQHGETRHQDEYQSKIEDFNQETTVKIIETIKLIKDHYFFPLRFLNLNSDQILVIDKSLNALFQAVLLSSNLNEQNNSQFNIISNFNFIENLDKLYQNYLFNNNSSDFVNLLNLSNILINIDLTKNLNFTIAKVTQLYLKNYIFINCSKIWDEFLLEKIYLFIKLEIIPKLINFPFLLINDFDEYYYYNNTNTVNSKTSNFLFKNLKNIADSELVNLRIIESFDILVDFPNSIIALKELRQSLKTSSQRSNLVNTFIMLCTKRLLLAGANTIDIITCYISTIKIFLIIDPRGVLLDKVCRPIRRYLQEREDTIEYIVHGLLNDQNNELGELGEELKKTEKIKKINNYNVTTLATVNGGSNNKVVVDIEEELSWIPDPIDALPDFKKSKVNDVIESLITLFHPKDIFLNEITAVLSSQLLKLTNYNINEIINKIELLKLRFGESEFDSLEVMVKDISDSKTMDSILHKNNGENSKFHSTVLSRLFWPNIISRLKKEKFTFPAEIQKQCDLYSSNFKKLKRDRELVWLPTLGTVEIELELEDRVKAFNVSPDKATVIMHFQEKPRLTMEELKNRFPDLSENILKKSITFWIKHGVVEEAAPGTYNVVENEKERTKVAKKSQGASINTANDNDNIIDAENENESEVYEAAMQNYWPFISYMLTLHGSLQADRIHSFLGLVVPKEMGYSYTKEQLRTFLEWCVKQNTLEPVLPNSFRLKKNE
ncbi:anaphase promoting complex subunit 2 ASCRUDRAFT_36935 [Ascoidea rubescens DSM 1968]|uniref:Anaphase-promoting complex subunit 2 n=1 Tax=Ascoidea rubescens DSM 1968 TaxID=1344418 RepID=A0A1D2VE89_9ASCO|nr:hypothetical protein ASCRUDRAFT_36935 [Ascoidea rubescens DSM 1968]ODV59961.1 hypothetical protein ASCRUDRAFT_36935 [Ascoidea rubescens DSM 1968]